MASLQHRNNLHELDAHEPQQILTASSRSRQYYPHFTDERVASQPGHFHNTTYIKGLIQDPKSNAKSSVLFSTVCKWVSRGEDISGKYDDMKPGSPFAGSATSPFSVILYFWDPSSPST